MTKVLIIAPLGYLASIPFMMESIQCLLDRGYGVHLVVPPELDPPFDLHGEGLTLKEIPRSKMQAGKNISLLWQYINTTRKLVRENEFAVVAGLSQLGIIIGAVATRGVKTKLVYLNDELWFNDHKFSWSYFPLKYLERQSNKRACLTITQDKNRGRLLAVINRADRKKMSYLPNSRSGVAELHRSILLHNIIGCSPDTKIILWNGAASVGDGALEIAMEAARWPKSYLFVYHFRSKTFSRYKHKLIKMHNVGRNFYLSEEFDYFDLEDVFASAHIGVAHYPDRGINSQYIASSSGKINSFLKVGVPCVVSQLPGLQWVEKSGAGLMIASPIEITAAIKTIDFNYAKFCKSALDVFNETLQFDRPFQEIISKMDRK